jgi:Tfp pilus assembly protein PilN
MSQQINLLPPRARPDRYLQQLGMMVGVTLLAVAGWWGVLQHETRQIQAEVATQAQELLSLQAQIARRDAAQALTPSARAQREALQAEAETFKDLLSELQRSALGRPQGYASVLEQLGRVPHPETWLTQIELRHREAPMTLMGLGLSEDAIVQYAAAVNRQFAAQGIQLRALELARSGAGPHAISFKVH